MPSANSNRFSVFFPIWKPLSSFSCAVTLSRTVGKIQCYLGISKDREPIGWMDGWTDVFPVPLCPTQTPSLLGGARYTEGRPSPPIRRLTHQPPPDTSSQMHIGTAMYQLSGNALSQTHLLQHWTQVLRADASALLLREELPATLHQVYASCGPFTVSSSGCTYLLPLGFACLLSNLEGYWSLANASSAVAWRPCTKGSPPFLP